MIPADSRPRVRSATPDSRVVFGWRALLRVWALGALLAVLGISLVGCASLPQSGERKASKSLGAANDTPLGRIAKASTADPEQSGFRLMPTGQYALQARLELARRAQRTLDVQYYQIHDDRTGRYLLRTLRDASERGVRVRLIIDDLYTSGMDPLLLGLDAYPNVEVRLFNPFPAGRKNFLTRFAVNWREFDRVHRRMHNKLFIADGVMAVAGGRNIADEYFMASAGANFVDLDTFVIGGILPRLGELFDVYWNSDRVLPIRAIVQTDVSDAQLRAEFERLTAAEAPADPARHRAERRGRFRRAGRGGGQHRRHARTRGTAAERRARLRPDRRRARRRQDGPDLGRRAGLCRHPDKVIGRISTYGAAPIDDVDSVRYNVIEMMRRARKDVVITSPYLIPGRGRHRDLPQLDRALACQVHAGHQLAGRHRRAGGAYRLPALPAGDAEAGHEPVRAEPAEGQPQPAPGAFFHLDRPAACQERGGRRRSACSSAR